MGCDRFDFKQFSILQDKCAMKVGTDGVLLGAWADVSGSTRHVLDIGAGTGIISLMIAQRLAPINPDFHIDAVEIDADAAQQAQDNIAASPWSNSISVFPQSLSQFAERPSLLSYDLIVSNPPFYNATLKPDDHGRAIARHKDSLPVAEIAAFAAQHLSPTGRLALIYPTDYDNEVFTAAVIRGLRPLRICDILTKEGKPCKRMMTEFGHNSAFAPTRQTLAIRDNAGRYTDQYLQLTADFYLHLND